MKRNQKTARASRSGTSPYAKYAKRPHRYSDKYQEWRSKFRKREENKAGG
jgi:hypothetical protein